MQYFGGRKMKTTFRYISVLKTYGFDQKKLLVLRCSGF